MAQPMYNEVVAINSPALAAHVGNYKAVYNNTTEVGTIKVDLFAGAAGVTISMGANQLLPIRITKLYTDTTINVLLLR